MIAKTIIITLSIVVSALANTCPYVECGHECCGPSQKCGYNGCLDLPTFPPPSPPDSDQNIINTPTDVVVSDPIASELPSKPKLPDTTGQDREPTSYVGGGSLRAAVLEALAKIQDPSFEKPQHD